MSTRTITNGLLCSCLVLAGCSGGDKSKQVPVFPVKGKVTFANAPVANAAVMFSPKGEQPFASGRTNTDGEYELTTYDGGDGAAAGDYVVLVTKSAAKAAEVATIDPKDPNYGKPTAHAGKKAKSVPGAESALPDKYSKPNSSDLNVTVKAGGSNDIPIQLNP